MFVIETISDHTSCFHNLFISHRRLRAIEGFKGNPFFDGHSGAEIRESGAGLWAHGCVFSDLIGGSRGVDAAEGVNEVSNVTRFDGAEPVRRFFVECDPDGSNAEVRY